MDLPRIGKSERGRAGNILDLLSCLLTITLSACASNPTGEATTPTAPQIATTAAQSNPPYALTPTLANPAAAATVSATPTIDIQTVDTGEQLDFWWSSDSQRLFYLTALGAWEYDVVSDVKSELANQELEARTPVPQFDPQLPPNATNVSVSTSGQVILYLIPGNSTLDISPSPTPEDGEVWVGGGEATLWVRTGTTAFEIGQMENCVHRYIWANDEQRVVITAPPVPAQCQETHAWLVDIVSRVLRPLFPKNEYPGEVSIYGLSPDGQTVLYRTDDHLFLMDLSTFRSRRLELPVTARGNWVDNETLLLIYGDSLGSLYGIALFDIGDLTLDTIVDLRKVPVATGSLLREARISPDGRWLAFSTARNVYGTRALWLTRIEAHG
jgi:hypothetical protein